MRCADCGARVDSEDNYCRRCGAALNHPDLPTVVTRSMLPIPWAVARGQLLRGAAALAVATAVEVARRGLLRRVAPADGPAALDLMSGVGKAMEPKRRHFPWSRAPRGEFEISETVIQRRVRFFKR